MRHLPLIVLLSLLLCGCSVIETVTGIPMQQGDSDSGAEVVVEIVETPPVEPVAVQRAAVLTEQRAVVLHAVGHRIDKRLQMTQQRPVNVAGVEHGKPGLQALVRRRARCCR